MKIVWTLFCLMWLISGGNAKTIFPIDLKNMRPVAVSAKTIVALSKDRKKLVLFSLKKKRVQMKTEIDLTSKEFGDYQLTPDGKILLMTDFSNRKTGVKIQGFDTSSGKHLFTMDKIFKRYVKSRWLSNCTFGVLSSGKPMGGVLDIFDIGSQVQKKVAGECQRSKLSALDIPAKEIPRLYWIQNFNKWSYYSNGSRAPIDWIGMGDFFALKSGKYPYFWFNELSHKGVLFRANKKKNKIQPITTAEEFFPLKKRDQVYLLRNNKLLLLTGQGGVKYTETQIKTDITAMWVFVDESYLLLQNIMKEYLLYRL